MILRPMRMTKGQKRIYDAVVALTLADPNKPVNQKKIAEYLGITGQLQKTSPRCTELVRDEWLVIKGKVGGDNGYIVNHNRNKSTLEKALDQISIRPIPYYGGRDF